QCVDTSGAASHIVFAVKPVAPRADFAVLANINTWNAYNDWGGMSKYYGNPFPPFPPRPGFAAKPGFLRPHPGPTPADDGNYKRLTGAELWTLNWMEDQGYNADVFTDADFERGIPRLQTYRALVLNTHPEYWTDIMRDRLDAYLAGGGNLVYLGGNGLF